MSVIVLVVGIVVTGLGLAALGFAIPVIDLNLGATLVSAGTTAVCGGLILIALAAAVSELRRVGDLLRSRPMPVRRAAEGQPAAAPVAATAPQPPTVSMPAPPMPMPAPAPIATSLGPILAAASQPQPSPQIPPTPAPMPASQRSAPPPPARQRPEMPVAPDLRRAETPPTSAADASAAALERLRSSIARTDRPRPEPAMVPEAEEVPLSPNGGHAQARRSPPEPGLEPRLSPDDRLGAATSEVTKASRLDFLFRSRQTARAEHADPNRPAGQPARGGPEAGVQPRYADAGKSSPPIAAPVPPSTSQSVPPAPAAEPRARDLGASAAEPASAVLKSGVVDGMAYTLYTDGSIEAKLPDGTVRFGSIAELRAHIEKNP